ncbi:hypothetical protein P4O66_015015 [Electrophorus voltai]|uniref:Uncharacterized protein n=1 Tax=Electrophorus voltai TaxID=2609070 RepID=A0AAD8Z018_9TELE|nr:hypothetical protein P4O66_015015 [Electrophorus voltai]
MGKNTDMVVFQTRILHLGCCIVMFLPAYGVRKNKPYSLKQMLLYIVPTVTGLIAVCLIIFCIVWNHR